MIFSVGKKKSFFNFIVFLFFLFLIIFPKGGFKINNIPITWGYILLGIVSIFLLFRRSYEINKEHVYILFSLVPFQIYSLISIWINGVEYIGFTISFFIGFFILPYIFLFIFSEYIQNLELEFFLKIFKRSILFIAIYGIFLFFYKIFSHQFIEIPFLTINYHDKTFLETTKFNDRGSLFKLISTYNNGNIYGICMLMLLPLYKLLEKSFLKRSLVKFSLLLTLSRTVWIGLIISEFFYDFFIRKNKIYSLIKFIISSCIFIGIILYLGKIMNQNISWFLDPTLGNRINSEYSEIHLLSKAPFKFIEEMLYNSILNIFGVLGFLFFLVGFLSPIYIFLIKIIKNRQSEINISIFLGLLTYLIISLSDSAILYIPILVIYWFLSSFLLNNKILNIDNLTFIGTKKC